MQRPSIQQVYDGPTLLDRRAALAGALCAIGAARTALAQTPSAGAPAVATTTSGRIRGFLTADGVHTYRGVPYGADTGGANRFLPPKPPVPWTNVRDATRWGSPCPQLPPTSPPDILLYIKYLEVPGTPGEDCLNLNLWTRAGGRDGGKRPVVMRIHGGGFTTGSGNNPLYSGHVSVRDHDVVYVAPNHRLNAFGFLDLSAVGDKAFALSANVGMLDLLACLRWIRANIENFGGDPNCVTIIGESGGSAKVATLMAMPDAKGLFHHAVMESGPMLRLRTHTDARQVTDRILGYLDRPSIAALQQLPWNRLLEAMIFLQSRRLNLDAAAPVPFGPIIDEKIPVSPFDPVANPLSSEIPLIVGYNRDEALFFLAQSDDLYRTDETSLRKRLENYDAAHADEILATYRSALPKATPLQLLSHIFTDIEVGYPSTVVADRHAMLGRAATYMYRFDWQPPSWRGRYGAFHGAEMGFVSGDATIPDTLTHSTSEAKLLAQRMNAAWMTFARTGKPGAPGLPTWTAYEPGRRSTMLLDDRCTLVISDPAINALWKKFPPAGIFGR